MHFMIDSNSLTSIGFGVLLMFLAAVISAVRYNGFRGPQRDRERAQAREDKEREERMIHENDVDMSTDRD